MNNFSKYSWKIVERGTGAIIEKELVFSTPDEAAQDARVYASERIEPGLEITITILDGERNKVKELNLFNISTANAEKTLNNIKKKKKTTNGSLNAVLWAAADKLHKNMDAAEYKHVVLGLIFLKYISDAFELLHAKLTAGEGEYEGADPEDPNEYRAQNAFFVPAIARWDKVSKNAKKTDILLDNGKRVDIGGYVDEAMEAIERQNTSLRGVLPKVYGRANLDRTSLGGLIDLIGTIALGTEQAQKRDMLGEVYEYFLGQFALAEGKKGGQFYTPQSVVKLLVEMLEPYEGRVFDPCCGSGGMFVHSEKFVKAHRDHYRKNGNGNGISFNPADRISIWGQESNQTTWRLCKMNLAIRGIDSSNIRWNNEGSFLNDAHKDLKADYVIANPPFNDSDWGGELLRDDARWHYGIPPVSNANFAWIQHFIYHLSPKGTAGFVMSNSALWSESKIERNIRKEIVDNDLIDCIVTLPDKLFYSAPNPVSLWFISREKKETIRQNKILLIDASFKKQKVNRNINTLSEDTISLISRTYHNWKKNSENYHDEKGFCITVDRDTIANTDYSLFPAEYIEINATYEHYGKEELEQILTVNIQTNKKRKTEFEDSFNKIAAMIELPLSSDLFTPREWVKMQLKDILFVSDERLGDRQEPEILTCTESGGLVLQRDRFTQRVATEDTTNYKVVRKTDIVYNPYLLWAGAIDQCWIVDTGITSPAYEVFRIKKGFEPTIIGALLKSSNALKKYHGISVGSIQRRRRAPSDKFLNLVFTIPSIDDQKRFSLLSEEVRKLNAFIDDMRFALNNILDVLSKNWIK